MPAILEPLSKPWPLQSLIFNSSSKSFFVILPAPERNVEIPCE